MTELAPDTAEVVAAEHHGPSVRAYVIVFFLLAALTAFEIFVPRMIDTGAAPRPSAMLVIALMVTALFKAALVAAFYMHLRYDSRTYTYMMLIATVVILFFLWLLTWGTVGRLDFDLFGLGLRAAALGLA